MISNYKINKMTIKRIVFWPLKFSFLMLITVIVLMGGLLITMIVFSVIAMVGTVFIGIISEILAFFFNLLILYLFIMGCKNVFFFWDLIMGFFYKKLKF